MGKKTYQKTCVCPAQPVFNTLNSPSFLPERQLIVFHLVLSLLIHERITDTHTAFGRNSRSTINHTPKYSPLPCFAAKLAPEQPHSTRRQTRCITQERPVRHTLTYIISIHYPLVSCQPQILSDFTIFLYRTPQIHYAPPPPPCPILSHS